MWILPFWTSMQDRSKFRASAADDNNNNDDGSRNVYRRLVDVSVGGGLGGGNNGSNKKKTVSYTITFPSTSVTESNKPVKTHLDEINFDLPQTSFKIGITVDPVRISSLQEVRAET
jgi:hypothetical protein